MKAKTMLGLIACASACVSLSAFGNETNGWFGVKVENAEIVHPNCATNGAAVTIDGSAIKLEDASLGIDNFAAAPTSDNIVKISATALLTPSSTNDFTDVSAQSQAGFAVGIDDQDKTNFYGYANGAWHKLAGANPGDGETSFSMILNYRDKEVSFYVDDVLLTSDDDPLTLASGADGLNGINASGSGFITSVTGAYEVAVVAIDSKKYGSVADALVAGGSDLTIKNVDESGNVSASTIAANGLSMAVCNALGLSVTEENTPAVKIVPVGSDTSANAITLCLDSSVEVEPGVAVKFEVRDGDSEVTGSPFASDAIQIPLEGLTGSKRYIIKPASVSTASGN